MSIFTLRKTETQIKTYSTCINKWHGTNGRPTFLTETYEFLIQTSDNSTVCDSTKIIPQQRQMVLLAGCQLTTTSKLGFKTESLGSGVGVVTGSVSGDYMAKDESFSHA